MCARRTVLADRGAAPEDEGSLPGVLGLPAFLPGRSEPDGVGAFFVRPDAGCDRGKAERDSSGLVEGDLVWDLSKSGGESLNSSELDRAWSTHLRDVLGRLDGILLERRATVVEAALEKSAVCVVQNKMTSI